MYYGMSFSSLSRMHRSVRSVVDVAANVDIHVRNCNSFTGRITVQ